MIRPLVYSALLAFTAACWYVLIRWPLWVLAAFAVSWGSALVAEGVWRVRDWNDKRRAERNWPMARKVER